MTVSLAASRSIGDTYHVGWALHTLGQSDVAVGDLAAASRHLRESLDGLAALRKADKLNLLLEMIADRDARIAQITSGKEPADQPAAPVGYSSSAGTLADTRIVFHEDDS